MEQAWKKYWEFGITPRSLWNQYPEEKKRDMEEEKKRLENQVREEIDAVTAKINGLEQENAAMGVKIKKLEEEKNMMGVEMTGLKTEMEEERGKLLFLGLIKRAARENSVGGSMWRPCHPPVV